MLFRTLTLAVLAVTTIASHLHLHDARGLNELDKRQQYTPNTKTAPGDTCAAAFGDGYQTCANSSPNGNRFCFNPTVGEVCCSNQWVCPPGNSCGNSFGNCCEPGVSCSGPSSSVPPPTSSAMTTPCANTTYMSTSAVVLPSVSTVPYRHGNGTKVATTGQPSSTTPLAKFTGAASRVELSVAGLVGVAGLVAGLL